MPLFSVIVPTWNRQDLVIQAIDSVLKQSCTDFELLVIDDGSQDATSDRVQQIDDNRVRYSRIPHQGVSAARNYGITQAQGQYITFLDSDDHWRSDKLQLQQHFFATQPQYTVVQTQEIWIRRGVRVNPKKIHHKQQGDIFQPSLYGCAITPSSVALDAEVLRRSGGFDNALPACEDYDLWLRITCQHRIGLIDTHCLTRYGGHADQLSGRYPAMDRFRIYALHKLLHSGICQQSQMAQVQQVLVDKTHILLTGLRKRNAQETQATALLNRLTRKQWGVVTLADSAAVLLDNNSWSNQRPGSYVQKYQS